MSPAILRIARRCHRWLPRIPNQEAFFRCVAGRGLPFAYFEAFDQPWKQDDAVASHWGPSGVDRTPKRWAATALGDS